MKNSILLFGTILALVACTTQTAEELRLEDEKWDKIHGCTEFPKEIESSVDVGNLKWDCEWQAAYKGGDVTFYYNTDSTKIIAMKKNSAY